MANMTLGKVTNFCAKAEARQLGNSQRAVVEIYHTNNLRILRCMCTETSPEMNVVDSITYFALSCRILKVVGVADKFQCTQRR